MFAALALISAAGIAIYLVLSLLSHLLLRHWHESAIGPESRSRAPRYAGGRFASLGAIDETSTHDRA